MTEWNKFPDTKPELVFFKNTMSAWFICLPVFGGAPLLLRVIERVPGEMWVVDRDARVHGRAETIIRLWLPVPPDENGKIY